MNNRAELDKNVMNIWDKFVLDAGVSAEQKGQFEQYVALLREWNERINLTAITTEAEIIQYHFQDSIAVLKGLPFKTGGTVCDIGSGAGFPGLPIKIMRPDLFVILLEVNQKKVSFLNMVIEALGLTGIEVCTFDWRTFLRQAEYEQIDYFFARASLQPEELIRLFKDGCAYKEAMLVYWASKQWKPEAPVSSYIDHVVPYTVGVKERQLIILKNVQVGVTK
ncbi:MAG TPA: 16S rRNA (guanine(527)-N(7))-methyltransferase RsmG [Candidatus Babeliales bacterium]|nr:16S rRNA (guanine(527)-N(7))-methyltransferase RsmG [Candidatus Babeliales bacterium]